MIKEDRPYPSIRTPYRICVRPGWDIYEAGFLPIGLRERLPVFEVPLRRDDPKTTIDLQALIDMAYTNSRYDRIDYSKPPVPPLDGDDAIWADELLRGWPSMTFIDASSYRALFPIKLLMMKRSRPS